MAEHTKQRIVVKVGTSTLTHDSGALDLRSMEHLVRTLADLHGMGHEVILVTSGAIARGHCQAGAFRAAPGTSDEAGGCRRGAVPG